MQEEVVVEAEAVEEEALELVSQPWLLATVSARFDSLDPALSFHLLLRRCHERS